MRKIAALLLSAMLVGAALADDSNFGYSFAWDVQTRKVLAVGDYSIGTLHDFLGIKSFDLSVVGFAGTTLATDGSNGITGGGALTWSHPLARGVMGQIGFGEALLAGELPHACVFFGIRGSL